MSDSQIGKDELRMDQQLRVERWRQCEKATVIHGEYENTYLPSFLPNRREKSPSISFGTFRHLSRFVSPILDGKPITKSLDAYKSTRQQGEQLEEKKIARFRR